MNRIKRVAAVFDVAILLLLASCANSSPQAALSSPADIRIAAKTRLYVVESFSANFGGNEALFRDRLRMLLAKCGTSVAFFEVPHPSGELALDPGTPKPPPDLNARLADFRPDGILDVRTTGWKGKGGLPGNPATQLTNGIFSVSVRLLDEHTRTEQWQANGSVEVTPDAGGDRLAQQIVLKLSQAGGLSGCPADIASF